jgi:hypothetical protein
MYYFRIFSSEKTENAIVGSSLGGSSVSVELGMGNTKWAVKRAEELDVKIQQTNDLIDETVYDLYGLTDEQIESVEKTVAGD